MKHLLHVMLFSTLLFASVGNIGAFRGDVTIHRGSEILKAKVGLKVEKNDKIQTIKRSTAQIIFNDNTTVHVGYDTIFSINEYIVDNKENSNVSLDINKGAIRVITGEIGKISPKRFEVSTKTATMGIRGTNFIIVANKNSDIFYCTHGKIAVNSNSKNQEVEAGYYTKTQPNKAPTKPIKFSPNVLKDVMQEHFRAYNIYKSNRDEFYAQNSININKNNIEIEELEPKDIANLNSPKSTNSISSMLANKEVATYNGTLSGLYMSRNGKTNFNLTNNTFKMIFDFSNSSAVLKQLDINVMAGSYACGGSGFSCTNSVAINTKTSSFSGNFVPNYSSLEGNIDGKFDKNNVNKINGTIQEAIGLNSPSPDYYVKATFTATKQ